MSMDYMSFRAVDELFLSDALLQHCTGGYQNFKNESPGRYGGISHQIQRYRDASPQLRAAPACGGMLSHHLQQQQQQQLLSGDVDLFYGGLMSPPPAPPCHAVQVLNPMSPIPQYYHHPQQQQQQHRHRAQQQQQQQQSDCSVIQQQQRNNSCRQLQQLQLPPTAAPVTSVASAAPLVSDQPRQQPVVSPPVPPPPPPSLSVSAQSAAAAVEPHHINPEWVSLMTSMNLQALDDTTSPARFQYALAAATSPATKTSDEQLTYLNQGQSYEVKLRRLADQDDDQYLKSIIRVIFHERRLQYMEKEQLDHWRSLRPGERVLDIDIASSYGILDVKIDAQTLNTIELVWDAQRDAGVFIKVNCISTEFTARKHGGEKGVPFRVQVETYALVDGIESGGSCLLHCASCQIKVFKPKGADRKQKTDQEKVDKRALDDRDKYHPTYEFTLLTEIPLEQVTSYLEQLQRQQQQQPAVPLPSDDMVYNASGCCYAKDEPRMSCASPAQGFTFNCQGLIADSPIRDSKSPLGLCSLTNNIETPKTLPLSRCSSLQTLSPISAPRTPVTPSGDCLSANSTAPQVSQWLTWQRFQCHVVTFQNYSGADVLRLSRDDLIQLCGLADGIRLNNALHSKTVRPRLTIYICQPESETSCRAVSGSNELKLPTSSGDYWSPTSNASRSSSSGSSSSSSSDSRSAATQSPSPYAHSPCPRDPQAASSLTISSTSSCTKSSQCTSTAPEEATPGGRRYNDGAAANDRSSVKRCRPGVSAVDGADDAVDFAVKRRCSESPVNGGNSSAADDSSSNNNHVYHALYLAYPTRRHLVDKISALYSIEPGHVTSLNVEATPGVYVYVTDTVVQNFVDESKFGIEINSDEDQPGKYHVLLKVEQISSTSS